MESMKDMGDGFSIRKAVPDDAALAVEFMRKLGTYQKMREGVTATEDGLRVLLQDGAGEAIFGELNDETVAFLYYYNNSSAFIGEKSIYIDGFYVDEEFRGRGLGEKMMQYMAQIALERRCGRLEWGCLDWNTPALDFYKKFGAKGVDIMTIYRLTPDNIQKLAGIEEK